MSRPSCTYEASTEPWQRRAFALKMSEAILAVWKWASTASRREERYKGIALTVSQLLCKTADSLRT